ncbi:MAG: MerR family transcriptional regulator [Pseudonocardiaceae bacterium]
MGGAVVVDELTIAELAARTGISVRTIRFYTGLGLIPPPAVRGRLGLYDECHAARLQLIRDLQELGFTLAAIEGYLARIPLDRSPEDLALHRAARAVAARGARDRQQGRARYSRRAHPGRRRAGQPGDARRDPARRGC